MRAGGRAGLSSEMDLSSADKPVGFEQEIERVRNPVFRFRLWSKFPENGCSFLNVFCKPENGPPDEKTNATLHIWPCDNTQRENNRCTIFPFRLSGQQNLKLRRQHHTLLLSFVMLTVYLTGLSRRRFLQRVFETSVRPIFSGPTEVYLASGRRWTHFYVVAALKEKSV